MANDQMDDSSTLRQLPPLIMLRAFEAAVRTGSMRRASQDIGVSHTVISRHVRNLEYWVGAKLVVAGPRGIATTQQGTLLYDSVSRAFKLISETTAELRPTHRGGVLRIWCVPGFATRWLMPRLSQVKDLLPGTEIVVRATDEVPDFERKQAHLMIGFDIDDKLPAGSIPLAQPRMFPVMSSRLLGEDAVASNVAELATMTLIHVGSYHQWNAWFESTGVAINHPLRGLRLSDANLALNAALMGQGVSLVTSIVASSELSDGQLVELLQTDIRLGSYYLMAASGTVSDPRVRRLRDWLVTELKDFDTK